MPAPKIWGVANNRLSIYPSVLLFISPNSGGGGQGPPGPGTLCPVPSYDPANINIVGYFPKFININIHSRDVIPGVAMAPPWHLQILVDQVTLSQLKGAD